MDSTSGLGQFFQVSRAEFKTKKSTVRTVYISELLRTVNGFALDGYIFNKVPLFYRELKSIVQSMGEGDFVTPIKETLDKLPTSESFRESHFGEIAAAIFAEDALELRKIYSKLTLLTAENSNAYKMDLVLYNPHTDPVEFIFGEVKSSPKTASDGLPAKHHDSCFADIFRSLNKYSNKDFQFDLVAAKDRVDSLPEPDRSRVRRALRPYSNLKFKYAGFAVIDTSTKDDDEICVLATRKNKKDFDVDVICVEDFPTVASSVYQKLELLRQACLP